MVDYDAYANKSAEAEAKADELLYTKQRKALNDAYAALQGKQVADSFAAFTFEEAMDQYIEEIEGEATEAHPNKLDRVARIAGSLLQAVQQLKSLPPEMFLDVNLSQAVNTPEEDDAYWQSISAID